MRIRLVLQLYIAATPRQLRQNSSLAPFLFHIAGIKKVAAELFFLAGRGAGQRTTVVLGWRFLLAAFLAVAALCSGAVTAVAGDSVSPGGNGIAANGRLRVVGGRLVNESGVPIQLRGMSSHVLTWYFQFTNARALQYTKERGANLFRAILNADSVNEGYNQNKETQAYHKNLLYAAVENALALDMYAIIDWHILYDKTPLLTVESAVEFFEEASVKYGGEKGVIFEICNEPNGGTTWEEIRRYAERVIPVIRQNAPDAIIIVGTPEYSSDLVSASKAPLPFENVMYAFHMYTGVSDYQYRTEMDMVFERGLAVFVSEWGVSSDPTTGILDFVEARDFLEYLRVRKISWCNWSLSNINEEFSPIRSDVWKLSGWVESDLTETGKLVFNALRGE